MTIRFVGKPRKSRRQGQQLIEFALILPLLILLVLGIIEFGYLIHNQLQVSNAAREGARSASLGNTTQEIRRRIIAAGQPALKTNSSGELQNGTIELKWSDKDDGSDNYKNTVSNNSDGTYNSVPDKNLIRVTVNMDYQSLTGLSGFLNRTLTTSVIMRREKTE